MKQWIYRVVIFFLVFLCLGISVKAAEKETIYNSPYVTFSPDGMAWTTNAGDKVVEWYPKGTTVSTGIPSSLRTLEEGEHYYDSYRQGEVPVGRWEVIWQPGRCIHDGYPLETDFHGVHFRRQSCLAKHYSGWKAYCADCGEEVTYMFLYMSKEAAASIDYLNLRDNLAYYYLCPFCSNLEQGAEMKSHTCKVISWNRYRVVYNPNYDALSLGGYMSDSIHMYNNADTYEGDTVTPVTHLTQNSYVRTGYEFAGWNTKPDGTGQTYADGQEIFNLTAENWGGEKNTQQGTITLYAQWRRSQSTLQVNPGGGTYGGRTGITSVVRDFDSEYVLASQELQAPKGYTVSFETNGGTFVSPITGTKHFLEWQMEQPFAGKMYQQGTPQAWYLFWVPDGNVDTVTALYEHDPVTLPATAKAGYSFGGWYYDARFTLPAGGAGDRIVPSGNLTLYAQWVDLVLQAKDNYAVNGGTGAVDLSWSQSDGNNKTYRLYQSRDRQHWLQINDAADISSRTSVEEAWGCTGRAGTYTVPYTGLYTLTANGAQGGSYGSLKGGLGGRITAKVWLNKGEVLTYTVGGQNGFHGGGSATAYGNGGGSTVVSSNQKGVLLTAGGGGGASPSGAGGAGGSSASVVSGAAGENGMAGGGGGYRGGTAGELIRHSHTESCYQTESGTTGGSTAFYASIRCDGGDRSNVFQYNGVPFATNTATGAGVSGHSTGFVNAFLQGTVGNSSTYISTPHAGKLSFSVKADAWGEGADIYPSYAVYSTGGVCLQTVDLKTVVEQYATKDTGSAVFCTRCSPNAKRGYDNRTYRLPFFTGSRRRSDGGSCGHTGVPTTETFTGTVTVDIPEGTSGVYLVQRIRLNYNNAWFGSEISNVQFTYSYTRRICGMEEGQVVSSKPAYGGSNYVNTACAYAYTTEAGKQEGNGSFAISSESIGFVDTLSLEGVTARDYAAPEKVGGFQAEVLSVDRIRAAWEEAKDRGTTYYHQAESYLTGFSNPLCRSNITQNTLTSGVKGYYVVYDERPDTLVTAGNGTFRAERSVELEVTDTTRYLHVAAVDVAGNLSETAHFPVGRDAAAWKLYTRQMQITEGDNVYPAPEEKTFYVRSDGKTPFLLQMEGYLDGTARENYQINNAVYESRTDGQTARNSIRTPSRPIQDGEIRTEAGELGYTTSGTTFLTLYPYSYTVRSGRNRELASYQKFMLEAEASGKTISLIPRVEADYGEDMVFSELLPDEKNGIVLIGDGEAPVIKGLEILEDRELIDRGAGEVNVVITAEDDLSGVRELYVRITNTDNFIEKTYPADADGTVRITLTKDEPIFSGDFVVTAYATDNVGNRREVTEGTTEFLLTAKVERMLEPHTPIFKRGESGVLTITTYGYADRVEVEFPEEMTRLDNSLNVVFDYEEETQYVREEKVQFMIPTGTPENTQYQITVRAYKGDKQLEEYPVLANVAVDGTLTGEIRTRLR